MSLPAQDDGPWEIVDGYTTPALEMHGPWDQSALEVFHARSLRGLHLNYAKGWESGGTYSFLSGLQDLEELVIIDYAEDLAPLSGLANLRYLTVLPRATQLAPFDFGSLGQSVEDIYIEWWPGARSLFDATMSRLLNLAIVDLPDRKYVRLDGMPNLVSLGLWSPRLPSLDVLRAATGSLEELTLVLASKVGDLQPLQNHPTLRKLVLNECRKVRDLAPLSLLQELQSVELIDCTVNSLAPLAGLGKLRHLDARSTTILDGDRTLAASLAGFSSDSDSS